MRRLWITLLLAAGGCFTDTPTASGCVDGAAGCPCAAGESCNAGLECRDPGVCVEEGCTPGALGCVCDEGQCGGGLDCDTNGVCVNPVGTGDGDGGVDTGVPPPTTAVDDGSADADDTASPTTASGTTGRTSGDVVTTGEGEYPDACAECIAEHLSMDNKCQNATACSMKSCVEASACPEDCVGADDPSGCVLGCCEEAGEWLMQLAVRLQCAADRCEACADVLFPDECLP